jgi:hypothetical protein
VLLACFAYAGAHGYRYRVLRVGVHVGAVVHARSTADTDRKCATADSKQSAILAVIRWQYGMANSVYIHASPLATKWDHHLTHTRFITHMFTATYDPSQQFVTQQTNEWYNVLATGAPVHNNGQSNAQQYNFTCARSEWHVCARCARGYCSVYVG